MRALFVRMVSSVTFMAIARFVQAWSVGAKTVPLKNFPSLFSYPAVFTASRNFYKVEKRKKKKM